MSRSATNDVNPYAPPKASGQVLALDEAGVGVWRDGNLLVMHKQAALPHICVRTGEPATRHVPLRVAWFRCTWQLRLDRLPMQVPMCSRWAFYSTVGRRALMLCGLTVAVALAAMFVLAGWSPANVQALLCGASIGALALLGAAALGEPLQFIRARGNYLWFRGAHPRFLERLPEWQH